MQPAIELRRFGQRQLLPNALNGGESESVHRRHLRAQIQITLPLLWQVHAAMNSVMTQQLHITSLADTLGQQMPSESELRLLHHTGDASHGALIPRNTYSLHKDEHTTANDMWDTDYAGHKHNTSTSARPSRL